MAETDDNSKQRPSEGEADEKIPPPLSSFLLFRRILTGFIQSVEEGADLISTSIAEELNRFLDELHRRTAGLFFLLIGVCVTTAGLTLWLQEWLGSARAALLVIGVLYTAGGLVLFFWKSGSERR